MIFSYLEERINQLIEQKKQSILKEIEKRNAQEKLVHNQLVNSQNCVACKIMSGCIFGFGALYLGLRTNLMWSSFARKERAFNLFMTSFVGLISFLQYYAAFDVYKAKNFIPEETGFVEYTQKSGLFGRIYNLNQDWKTIQKNLDELEEKIEDKK